MCPEPALLAAYLDGTLFHRDHAAINHHLETCIECRALLTLMQEKRHAERSTTASRSRITIGASVVLVAMLGYGVWAVLPRSKLKQSGKTTPAVRETPPSSPGASTPVPAPPSGSPAPQPVSAPAPTPKPLPRAIAEEPSTPPAPRVLWRTRDVTVESSSDGGMTWVTEHTADRTIRASAFVDANVAWVVGDSGLILRRTTNGWFGASPPADGSIIAVNASSPSRATVTLEDGRVFSTANGGVTWSAP